MPPRSSCASNVSEYAPKVSTAPIASASPTASADADPQPRQHVATAEPREVGDEDADDQRGFEAFAEADEEGGEHGRSRVSWRGSEVTATGSPDNQVRQPHFGPIYAVAASRPISAGKQADAR